MNTTNKTIALALSGAFALSVAATTLNAAENPFAIKSLSSGYQVADADKAKDGKCGEGKCSAEKKEMSEKAHDGKCGADKKTDAKAADGKCGEGKCGADKK